MPYAKEQDDDNWDDRDDWDDSDSDDEQYSDDDTDDLESEPTIDCPYCGREMLEVCVQCPRCGMFLSKEDLGREKHPWWITLAIILSLVAVTTWFLFP
ncbi:MAG: hypothetical protein NT138_01240 [Planctomycetales bacterium]|nr:hypothetical protein [Planctomycetales bacterium]